MFTKRRYSPIFGQLAVLHSFQIDWSQPDYSGWYSYDCSSADVREVLPTHSGGQDYSGSKSGALNGMKVINLSYARIILDEKERAA